MAQKETVFYHGDVIHVEYPEHIDWYIPDLCKHLNKLLLTIDVKIEDTVVDYNKRVIQLSIRGFDSNNTLVYNFKEIREFEVLNSEILNGLNSLIKNKEPGYRLIGYRPSNDANLTLSFATIDEIDSVSQSYKLINDINFGEIGKKPKSIKEIRTINDFDIKLRSDLFPGDYYLPLHNTNSNVEFLELVNKIASLDPNNKITITVGKTISTEEVSLIFELYGNTNTVLFNVRDFDLIGLELNRMNLTSDSKYILIEPDEESLFYAFIDKEKFIQLQDHSFTRKGYDFS